MFYDYIKKFLNQLWFYLVLCIDIKKAEILFRVSSALEKLKNMRVVKMDKKRLKIALVVLYAVKCKFPETEEVIDDTLKDECEKEKITADEVTFLQV